MRPFVPLGIKRHKSKVSKSIVYHYPPRLPHPAPFLLFFLLHLSSNNNSSTNVVILILIIIIAVRIKFCCFCVCVCPVCNYSCCHKFCTVLLFGFKVWCFVGFFFLIYVAMFIIFLSTTSLCFVTTRLLFNIIIIFFFWVPQLDLWGLLFLVRFLRMWPVFFVFVFCFFNPTIEIVTFRLRGWCMLGVFLLPAFTSLEHGCQDLLSRCDLMRVCTAIPRFILSSQRVLGGNGVRTHVNSKEESPPLEKFSPEEDRTHDAASSTTASPTCYQRDSPGHLIS